MSERHFVYIIALRKAGVLTGPVKVGVTKALGSRLSSLQTGCWERLEVAYRFSIKSRDLAYEIESIIHSDLSDFRIQGEWFSLDPLCALEALCGVVFNIIETRTAGDRRQVELVESCAIDNLKIVTEQFWGLTQ